MFKAFVNGSSQAISLIPDENGFEVDGKTVVADIHENNSRKIHMLVDNQSYFAELIHIDRPKKTVEFLLNGKATSVTLQDRFDELLHEMGFDKVALNAVSNVIAPMPGLVLSVKVEIGAKIAKGDVLLVLEAMKMENAIKSPGPGIVKSILVSAGMAVDKNQNLIEFE